MPTQAEIDLGIRLQALLVAAGFGGGGGGGGGSPLATNLLTGTVKTDVLELDPVVYVKASVDTNFYTKTAGDARYALAAHTHTFASLTSKPTTIAGYGITDLNALGDARWSPLGHSHTFSQLSNVSPTWDADVTDAAFPIWDAASGKFIPLSSTNFLGVFSGLNDLADVALFGVADKHILSYDNAGALWRNIAAPFYTKTESDALYALIGHTHTFASLTAKPTTIGGYGITDFNSLGDARWAALVHVHAGTDITTGLVAAARLGSGSGGAAKFLREDQTWQVPAAGAVAIKTAEVDFGARAVREGIFAIADATIAGGQKITAWQSGEAPTGRDADEVEFASFHVVPRDPVAGVGFTVHLRDMIDVCELQGKFKINYLLG
jgi:hypothetical protein